MKTLVHVFWMILLGYVLNSCSPQQFALNTTAHKSIHNNKVQYLNIKCFQTLSNSHLCSECLASNDYLDVFYIVNFTCPGKSKSEIYYDGKNIRGNYVFVGTYSYETKKESIKTVQAYMPKDNFQEFYEYNKSELKGLLDIVLSYNAMQ